MGTDFFSPLFTERLAHTAYNKRESAALELQKHIANKEASSTDIPVIIHTLIQDFVYNNNSNARNGGLLGLAATTIALGPGVAPYLDIVVPPILACFADSVPQVRHHAAEIMYELAKVAKGEVLRFFNSTFDALCKIAADQTLTVLESVNILDRGIKDVVSELSTTYVSPHLQAYDPIEPQQETANLVVPTFSLPHFIPVLTQRIYARNSSTRQYLMSWITVLNSIPDLKFISFLPDFLDGLFDCLSDPSKEVRTATSGLLDDFLQKIKQAAVISKEEPINEKGNYMPGQGDIVQYDRIVKVLVQRLSSDEEDILKTVLHWINEFIAFASNVVIELAPFIIKTIHPCLAFRNSIIRDTAIEISRNLQRFGFEISPVSSVPEVKNKEEQAAEEEEKHTGNMAEVLVQTGSENGDHTASLPYAVVSTLKEEVETRLGHRFEYRLTQRKRELERLLNDRNFRLVKLEDKDGHMTLFTPALHPKISEDVERERWTCIASTKNDPADFIDWNDVRVIDGDNGGNIRVMVHPDHRDKIMQQLQRNEKYWWIDIICMQPDMPRGVADQIHEYCNSCIHLPPSTYRNWRHELLQNSKLRLLKVEHDETQIGQSRRGIKSLTVVTPALDLEILEDAKQRGWHCLSHLWGDPAEWIVWNDSGVVDGVTGEAIKPKVHPNKRDEIMKLLQLDTRYWWIDIFCAQSDTPLVIMGDIYKNCTDCYTLVDCPYEVFDRETVFPVSFVAQISEYHLEEAAHGYLDIISKAHRAESRFVGWFHSLSDHISKDHRVESGFVGWSQALSDLLLWPHNQSQQNHDSFLKHKKDSIPKEAYNVFKELPVDKKSQAARKYVYNDEYDPREMDKSIAEWFMMGGEPLKTEDLVSAQRALAEFLDCRWMGRIWTLQEIALPRKTYVPSGDKSPNVASSADLNYGSWTFSLEILLKVIMRAHDIRATPDLAKRLKLERMETRQTPRETLEQYQKIDPVLARIYTDYRKVVEAIITIGYSGSRLQHEHLARKILLNSFATSQRTSLYPIDYVYGVLGILDIDIPRLENPEEVWQAFSRKIRERYPDIHVPNNVDLKNATKMEDVYGGFGFITENYVSASVADYILKVSVK